MESQLKALIRTYRRCILYFKIFHKEAKPLFDDVYNKYLVNFYKQSRSYLSKNRLFTFVVLTPWLISAVYLILIATPEYVSSARIVIEKELDQAPINISTGIFGGGGSGNTETYLTQEYITSREMINRLQEYYDFQQHYQTPFFDRLSRLKNKPSEKDYQNYFQKKVSVTVDTKTNELNITVRAFSARIAQVLAQQIIEQSKHFVNRVSNTVADKQYNFSKTQLKQSKDKLFKISKDVLEWQNENGMFDPTETAKVVNSVTAGLKSKLVEKQTDFITYSAFMQPESSKLVSLKEEIDALKKQIEEQTSDLLSKNKGSDNLNRILIDYQWLQLQLKFAQAEYEAAQQAFDAAAINLSKQKNSIIEIESPNLPDEYEYPQRLYDLVNLLILFLVIFFLIQMTINIVHEHID